MADQSPRDQPEGFDQSSSPTVPRLNMLQTIPNNFLDFEFNRFILWMISSVIDSSTTVTVLLVTWLQHVQSSLAFISTVCCQHPEPWRLLVGRNGEENCRAFTRCTTSIAADSLLLALHVPYFSRDQDLPGVIPFRVEA